MLIPMVPLYTICGAYFILMHSASFIPQHTGLEATVLLTLERPPTEGCLALQLLKVLF